MKLADGTVIAVGWEQCYATCKREVFEASCDEREAGDDKIIVRLIEELSHAQSAKDASEQEARDEIANLNSHLENGEQMYVAVRNRCASVEAQLGRRDEEIDALNTRLTGLIKDNQASAAGVVELRREIERLKAEVSGLECDRKFWRSEALAVRSEGSKP